MKNVFKSIRFLNCLFAFLFIVKTNAQNVAGFSGEKTSWHGLDYPKGIGFYGEKYKNPLLPSAIPFPKKNLKKIKRYIKPTFKFYIKNT